MAVDCVWAEDPLSTDNRSWYATNSLWNWVLDHAEVGFVHRNGFKEFPSDSKGAVVVIHGEHQAPIAKELEQKVMAMEWSLSIITGDEPAIFPSRSFSGGRHKVWVQFPVPGLHDHASHFLTAGYAQECTAHLHHYQAEMDHKTLNHFFAGQINHASRRACITQLRMHNNGVVYESPGFWQGMPHSEYYKLMAQARIAPCPAGGATPESLRVFEALEARCVPIVEDRWPPGYPRTRPGMTGYWKIVLGEDPPFPTLTDWRNLPSLYDQVLREWPDNRDRLQVWWAGYKQKLCRWLEEDIRAIA